MRKVTIWLVEHVVEMFGKHPNHMLNTIVDQCTQRHGVEGADNGFISG